MGELWIEGGREILNGDSRSVNFFWGICLAAVCRPAGDARSDRRCYYALEKCFLLVLEQVSCGELCPLPRPRSKSSEEWPLKQMGSWYCD